MRQRTFSFDIFNLPYGRSSFCPGWGLILIQSHSLVGHLSHKHMWQDVTHSVASISSVLSPTKVKHLACYLSVTNCLQNLRAS